MSSIISGIVAAVAGIGFLLALYFFARTIYFLIGYGTQGTELKIKMDSFMSFYVIAPEKWELNEMFVSYKRGDYRQNWFAFSFNLIDTVKYERWRKQKRKHEEKQRKTNEYVTRYTEAIQCIKRDINEFKQQNDALVEKVVAEMFEQDEKLRR